MNKQNLIKIIELAKSCNQKRYSSLSEEQKMAAMLVGDTWPVTINNGRLKYSATGDRSAWSASYKAVNDAKKVTGIDIAGMNANSMHVILDEPLPDLIETSWQDAVDSFPSWKVPRKVMAFSHLPQAMLDVKTELSDEAISFSPLEIGQALAYSIIILSLKDFKDAEPVNKRVEAMITLAYDYPEEFKKICTKLGLPYDIFYEQEPEEAPRGSISYSEEKFRQSYVASYLPLAYQGKFLRKIKE